ncbi:MAG: nitrile hydratase subunit alpha [Candidatus Binatia bacterium]|nr:nitrile hydratase subunit alpha [Candidatus Binatia bacterium]
MSGKNHDHDHEHSENELRAEALETILTEKGIVTAEAIDGIIRLFEEDIGPMNGARVVARAWTDDDFRIRLLADATTTVGELELAMIPEAPLVVVPNEPGVHNVVVCTLCSCYPSGLLGISPAWYKDPAYRSRVVREPRKVLSEMGLDLDPDLEVRVWDSSAELRYMVLPERPSGCEDWDTERLATLVTRDSMIGTGRLRDPSKS